MKKTIPFELFGPNQYLMFDILRLAELERVLGKPIAQVIASQDIGVDFVLKSLPIAMKQHYRETPEFFANKIEEHLDGGGSFDDVAVPLVRAILASGLLGKEVADRAIGLASEVTEEQKNDKKAKLSEVLPTG